MSWLSGDTHESLLATTDEGNEGVEKLDVGCFMCM